MEKEDYIKKCVRELFRKPGATDAQADDALRIHEDVQQLFREEDGHKTGADPLDVARKKFAEDYDKIVANGRMPTEEDARLTGSMRRLRERVKKSTLPPAKSDEEAAVNTAAEQLERATATGKMVILGAALAGVGALSYGIYLALHRDGKREKSWATREQQGRVGNEDTAYVSR